MIDIFKKLKELNFPKGQYVVVGGVLSAHRIRESKDLDILVTPRLYLELQTKGYKRCMCEQCLETSRIMLKKDNVDIVPTYMFGNYIGDTNQLIKDADIINGFPFVRLEELIKFKRELGRPKDLDDIKLIKRYLKDSPG